MAKLQVRSYKSQVEEIELLTYKINSLMTDECLLMTEKNAN
jgi:hypothetical protein